MRSIQKSWLPVIAVVLAVALSAEAAASIFSLEQIQTGMKGKGRSVFVGREIEEFEVEILGILRNYQPKRNLIIAKLSGQGLENSGVAQGMSGSPVYIDGKLIGAVAYSFPFAKEPIAGITPIEEMMAIPAEDPPRSSFSPRIPIRNSMTLEELLQINESRLPQESVNLLEGRTLKPMDLPLVCSGFPARVFNQASPVFSRLGFNPINGGPADQISTQAALKPYTLREGDAVGVQLLDGDVNVSAIGTVTYARGGEVLAFGHPMYNLGAVEYGMTTADVITVVPSFQTSFKMATAGRLIGKFTQDRSVGVFGELGKMPRNIPLNVNWNNARGQKKEFKIRVAEDKLLTPFLVNLAIASIMPSEDRSLGDMTLEVDGDIYLENGKSIHVEDLFSGAFDSTLGEVANLMTAVVFFLTNNEFEDLSIHRIDLNVHASEEIRFSYLEKVWLDRYDVNPGERIHVKIFTRNFRGQQVMQDGYLTVPHLPSGSEFYLIVADALSLQRLEMGQYRTRGFLPRSLEQLIRVLNNQRKNNRIYLKILASKPGLFLKGEEMPNLPPTMKEMFTSSRVAIATPTEMTQSTLGYTQLGVPYVFKGSALIPIKIR